MDLIEFQVPSAVLRACPGILSFRLEDCDQNKQLGHRFVLALMDYLTASPQIIELAPARRQEKGVEPGPLGPAEAAIDAAPVAQPPVSLRTGRLASGDGPRSFGEIELKCQI